jgi:acyl-CoA synthetase (AMP-forming)/AMP-acid ligase II
MSRATEEDLVMKHAAVPDIGYVPTIPNLLRRAVQEFGDREFLVDPTGRYTFAEAEARSADLALGLLALGVGKGTRIGLLMPNSADWVLAWLAASRIGAHTTLLSTFSRGRELDWALRFNDLDTVLMSSGYLRQDYVELLEGVVPELAGQEGTTVFARSQPYLRHVVVWGETRRPWAVAGGTGLAELGAANPVLDREFLTGVEDSVAPADSLLTVLTSGSSAFPKAVVHTHGASIRATRGFMDYMDFHQSDRTYTGQPFFWIGGMNMNLFPCLHMGGCLVFSEARQPEEILDVIAQERVTRVTMPGPQVKKLVATAAELGRDLSTVRAGVSRRRDEYGDLLPPDRLLSGGGGIGLGMTETWGMHSMEKVTSVTPLGKGGNWGRHLPGMDRRVIDPVTGHEVETDAEGELYVRGHALMTGYYKREREEVFTRDGYFATGDLVSIDEDDYLSFTSRLNEMVKTSGANVAPREVEMVAQSYPGIREALVFGLPDKEIGEVVICVLVASDGVDLDTEALRQRLRNDLAPYKVPQEYLVMAYEDIPRTGSDKPNKPSLRAIVAEKLGRPATRS